MMVPCEAVSGLSWSYHQLRHTCHDIEYPPPPPTAQHPPGPLACMSQCLSSQFPPLGCGPRCASVSKCTDPGLRGPGRVPPLQCTPVLYTCTHVVKCQSVLTRPPSSGGVTFLVRRHCIEQDTCKYRVPCSAISFVTHQGVP